MSAPGSLIDSSPYTIHKASLYSPDQEVKNGFSTHSQTYTSYSNHHASNNIPNTNFPALVHKLNGLENTDQAGYYKCPHCGAKFQQTHNNYDIWFDHVAECTS